MFICCYFKSTIIFFSKKKKKKSKDLGSICESKAQISMQKWRPGPKKTSHEHITQETKINLNKKRTLDGNYRLVVVVVDTFLLTHVMFFVNGLIC